MQEMGDVKRRRKHEFDPCVGKIPWSSKWQPTPVFLPGKSYGQKSLVGYSPWGHKESDTTEHARKQANRRTLAKTLEKAMAPHSSTLAWKIPWMEESDTLQSMGSLRVGHD